MPKDQLEQDYITVFGETNFRNQRKSFGIKRDDRRKHTYIIGKTGMGKTTLLENMIISDIVHGEGCCYIDPHGDTAEKILNYVPSSRVNDVIYMNPADMEFPIAFNILEAVDESQKHLIASGIVGVFKKQFAESWGPRLEYILRNAILALLDYPGSTLLGIMRILVEKDYRDKVIEKIKDPVVKSFWTNEYSKWNDRVLQEVISPIQNKVGQFLSNFLIRNVVGQVKSTIDLRDIMDNKKILILNLSKGRIGEDTMQLLGSMIVTKLYLAAMSRVNIPEKERQDFYLYVDEFQNFATDSFSDILSEARKYRLNLIVAHQYIEQLPELVSAAIFGNVGTLICFRVGAADAEVLIKEFTPFFLEEDLVNLPAFSIYLKLMIDGVSSDPFSAATLPPLFEDMFSGNSDKIIKVSRERYAHPRAIVEDKINRWSGNDLSDKMIEAVGGAENESVGGSPVPRSTANPARRDTQRKATPLPVPRKNDNANTKKGDIVINCSRCGKEDRINFVPDPTRPIYCDDCLKIVREDRRKKGSERSSPIEEKIKKLEEVVQEKPVEPAISLSEALNKQPVNFSHSPRPASTSRPEKKNDFIQPRIEHKTNQQRPITRVNNSADKIVRPAPKLEPKLEAKREEVKDGEFRLEWYEEAKKMLGLDGKSKEEEKTIENRDKKDPSGGNWLD